MSSFYFQNYSNNAQTNEQRVKNAHAGTLINKNVIIPPQPPHPPTPPPHPIPPPRTNPGMPTRHRTPTSTYPNQNIERVSNHHLQKWTACQERTCRNVNKQERYHPPPTPPTPHPPHPNPPHPPTPSHPPEQTLACQHATINATASRNTAKRAENETTHTKTRKHVRWHGCFDSDANMKKWQHSATPSRGPYQKQRWQPLGNQRVFKSLWENHL